MQEIPFKNSFWAEDDTPERTPPLESDIRADVVVIGGGIVGLSCAYYLRKEGLDVVLLERDHVGFHASGQSGGVLSPTLGPWSGEWADMEEPERTRPLMEWIQGCVDEAERVCEAEEIDCEYLRRPWYMFAREEGDLPAMMNSIERHLKMGAEARYIDPQDAGEITTYMNFGAMALGHHAVVQPWKMVRGYREAILRDGVHLYEGTSAESIDGGTQVVVKTHHGSVTADKAVVAMNAWAGQFEFMQKYIVPSYTYAIATEVLDQETTLTVGRPSDEVLVDYNAGTRRLSGIWVRFGADGHFVAGGGSVPAMDYTRLGTARYDTGFRNIRAEMVRRYPTLERVSIEAAWGGAVGGTTNYLPIFAEEPDPQNVIVALVANGRGMCLGSNAGRLVKGLVLGRDKLDGETRNFLDFCARPQDQEPAMVQRFREMLAGFRGGGMRTGPKGDG